MDREIWDLLKSAEEGLRRKAWRLLRADLMADQTELPRGDVEQLLAELHAESQPAVRRMANEALLAAALLRDQRKPDARHSGLARWFWRPFQSPTAVFRAIEVDRHRDEDAVIELARALPRSEYPQAVLARVPLEAPRWKEWLDFAKACCFVGRLEIYGREAVRELSSDTTRFYFPDEGRPPGLRPGALDPARYHRIRERRTADDLPRVFAAGEENERRTDYALVQRYYQVEKQRTVFQFAGCSTLGTLGAVNWAVGLQHQEIPLPAASLSDHARLEALLEVSAPIVEHPWQWQPESPRLLRLIVGDEHEWDESRREWGRPPTERILLMRDAEGGCVYSGDDRRIPTFRDGSELVQFIELLYRRTGGKPGRTVTEAMCGDDPAWKKVMKTASLRTRLRVNLPGAVSISVKPPEVTLNVPILLRK